MAYRKFHEIIAFTRRDEPEGMSVLELTKYRALYSPILSFQESEEDPFLRLIGYFQNDVFFKNVRDANKTPNPATYVCPKNRWKHFAKKFEKEEVDPETEEYKIVLNYCQKYTDYINEEYKNVSFPNTIPELLTFLIKIIPGYCTWRFGFCEDEFIGRESDEEWLDQNDFGEPPPPLWSIEECEYMDKCREWHANKDKFFEDMTKYGVNRENCRGIGLTSGVPEGHPTITGNEKHTRAVFLNLPENQIAKIREDMQKDYPYLLVDKDTYGRDSGCTPFGGASMTFEKPVVCPVQ